MAKKKPVKRKRAPKKGMALSKEEYAMATFGSSRPDSYAKYLGRARKYKKPAVKKKPAKKRKK